MFNDMHRVSPGIGQECDYEFKEIDMGKKKSVKSRRDRCRKERTRKLGESKRRRKKPIT